MKKNFKQTNSLRSNWTRSLMNDLAGDELWREFSSKVTPLNHRDQCAAVNTASYSTVKKTLDVTKNRIRELSKSQNIHNYLVLPGFSYNVAAELDRKSIRKIRRGKTVIEARLDLHGMTQLEAHKSLIIFLERAYVLSKKTVLVITGKGLTQGGKIGTLRRSVPKWMNERPMKNWIRSYDKAAPSDGGEGALYVQLRR